MPEEIGDHVHGFHDRIRGKRPIEITYFSLLGPRLLFGSFLLGFFLTVVDAHHAEPPHLSERGGGHGDDEQHQPDIGALYWHQAMQAAEEAARDGDNSAVLCTPRAPILRGAACTPSTPTPAPPKLAAAMVGWTTTVKIEHGKR